MRKFIWLRTVGGDWYARNGCHRPMEHRSIGMSSARTSNVQRIFIAKSPATIIRVRLYITAQVAARRPVLKRSSGACAKDCSLTKGSGQQSKSPPAIPIRWYGNKGGMRFLSGEKPRCSQLMAQVVVA